MVTRLLEWGNCRGKISGRLVSRVHRGISDAQPTSKKVSSESTRGIPPTSPFVRIRYIPRYDPLSQKQNSWYDRQIEEQLKRLRDIVDQKG